MEAEIKIYQSCWKNLWLILGCMLFTVGGIYMITDESCRLVNKIIGGWLGVIFFGGGGLWLAVTTLYNAVKRRKAFGKRGSVCGNHGCHTFLPGIVYQEKRRLKRK